MAPGYRCTHCRIDCVNMRNLNRHMSNHDTKFWYSCQHCMFTTKRKDNLNRHLKNYHAGNNGSESLVTPSMYNVNQFQPLSKSNDESVQSVSTETLAGNDAIEFDKRLHLPHNFIYAGATQSVSLHYFYLLTLLM